MPWRLPRWACITLPVAVTLKRFLAPDLVFSLGIWLSCCRNGNAPREGAFAAKMLVRALKVLRFSLKGNNPRGHRHGSPYSAGRLRSELMAEVRRIGNVKWVMNHRACYDDHCSIPPEAVEQDP